MGYSRASASDWSSYHSTHTAGRSYDNITTAKSHRDVKNEFLPKNITVRESRDSTANPASTPIIMALDCTGSMNSVLEAAIKGFGDLFVELYDRRPVSDPHVLGMMFDDIAIGADPALQATQFECDIKLADQFRALYATRNGGANNSESYHLPLYFAATKTSCDAFSKRGRKGYLFTVGDEEVPEPLTPAQIRTVFGPDEAVQSSLSYEDLLRMVEPNWHVFHIMVEEGSHFRGAGRRVVDAWTKVLGQRAIPLAKIGDLTSVVLATIEVTEGRDRDDVVKSFSGSTALTVAKATASLSKAGDGGSGVVRL